ncbi:MAG: spore coat protein U domain-containing protein [Dokdonella sp.]
MNAPLVRVPSVWLLIGFGLAWSASATAANVSCSASMSALSFGTVDPQSSLTNSNATLTYTCTNSNNKAYSATVCFSLGEPAGGPTNPRQMDDGAGHVLNFQMYQNPTYTLVWGSDYFGTFRTPLTVNLTIAGSGSQSGSATLYGQVSSGQTSAIPGSYNDNFSSGDTALTINELKGNVAPGACAGAVTSVGSFPFNITATVARRCTVTTGTTLNLGTVASSATNVSGNNSIVVTCATSTPYYVGLSPSNANNVGAGLMVGTGSNTDKVPYQLRSASGLSGTIWGNTSTSTSVGNGVAGTGNGVGQSFTVYATVTSANYTPDTYTDTVTVNVNY